MKTKKLCIIMLIVVFSLTVNFSYAFAVAESNNYSIDIPYNFPLTPDDEE